MQVPGEAEALEEVVEVQRQEWMHKPADELLRLFHYEGALNWLLFGPGESWSGSNSLVPGYAVQSGLLKPGQRFGAAGGKGGFLAVEERRRSAIEEAAEKHAQSASSAGPPLMTFGARFAQGVRDVGLAAKLARQREKHAQHHAAEMAAAVEEETVEEETEEQVTQEAQPSYDLPLGTIKDTNNPSSNLPPESAEASEASGIPLQLLRTLK
mmetsp:Transcript_2612/g.4946  ORF Transcript_2612/g.4946 Transcript_2612/m.4946 type:complete len:211 (+) Transcript_2612:2-634(+)